jgi:actin-related protein
LLARKAKNNDQNEEAAEEEIYDPIKDPPAVIVHGAASTKIGLGGESYPRYVYPEQSADLSARIRRFPLKGSEPTNEEYLKAYWDASIKHLHLNQNNKPLLLSLPTANLTICPFKDLVQKHFFDRLPEIKLTVISDPFLSLINFLPKIRKLTAIVVDIGFSQIRIVPFYDASIIEENFAQIDFGGYDLTLQLGSWLQKQGYEGPIDAMFLRDIKEKYCYIREKNQIDSEEQTISYSLGQKNYTLGTERWKLPELFFFKKFFTQKVSKAPRSDAEGNKFDMKNLSLSVVIANVIKSLNFRLWETMCNNICLTGGGAKFTGLKERLIEELKELLPENKNDIRIHTTKEPALTPFIGATKLAMLSSYQKYWYSQEEYEIGEYEFFL